MKTFLLSAIIFSVFLNKAHAQPCSISNLVITTSGNCTATVSFDMDRNNGNKYVYVHLWTNQNFNKVDKSKFTKGAAPKRSNIDGGNGVNAHDALATVGIDNFNYDNPVHLTQYKPDGTVTLKQGSGFTVTPLGGNKYRYTIYDIPLGANINGGCTSSNIKGIVWSTQANSANSHIHCSLHSTGDAVNPTVVGSSNCLTGKYTVTISNPGTSPVNGVFDIYVDNGGSPGDGIFDPIIDTKIDGDLNFTVNPGGSSSYTGLVPSMYFGYDLWVQVRLSNNTTILKPLPSGSCTVLPVTFKALTATRSNQNVLVKWEVATEEGVKGYNVQRNTNGEWQNVAYVPSKANGNSVAGVFYQHTDINNSKVVSQYRIEEVAFTGNNRVSDIRSVKGDGQMTKLLVYPNPSNTGKVNILFEEAGAERDVFVVDAVGRVVKQYKKITSSSLAIDNLTDGFYTIKVVDVNSGSTSIEKLIIKKR